MPLIIPNTTSAPDYDEFGGAGIYTNGFITITGSTLAFLRLYYGKQGSGEFTDDIPLPPGTYPLAAPLEQPISGLAVKDFIAGTHVQYSGALFGPKDAAVIAGAPSAAQVTASGAVVSSTITQLFATASGTLTISTVSQDVPGLSVTFDVLGSNATVQAVLVLDVAGTPGFGIVEGLIVIDGAAANAGAIYTDTGAASLRATAPGVAGGAIAAGTHTVKAQALKSINAGGASCIGYLAVIVKDG